MQPRSCECSPKQCFPRACRMGKSRHCRFYLDRNLSGDETSQWPQNIVDPQATSCYAVSADYCGQIRLCLAAHSFREAMLAVSLPIPNLTNQLEVKEKRNILDFTVSRSSQKLLRWCCAADVYLLVFISNVWPYLIAAVNVGSPSPNSSLDHG